MSCGIQYFHILSQGYGITISEFSNATIIPSLQLALVEVLAVRLSHVRVKFSPHANIYILIHIHIQI
jgi:hypothetical protein